MTRALLQGIRCMAVALFFFGSQASYGKVSFLNCAGYLPIYDITGELQNPVAVGYAGDALSLEMHSSLFKQDYIGLVLSNVGTISIPYETLESGYVGSVESHNVWIGHEISKILLQINRINGQTLISYNFANGTALVAFSGYCQRGKQRL